MCVIIEILNELLKTLNAPYIGTVSVFISVITQVILRFGFSSAAAWPEETAVYGLIFAVYLGAALGVKERAHVRITFLVFP